MLSTPRTTVVSTISLFATMVASLSLVAIADTATWKTLPLIGTVVLFSIALVAGYLEIPFPFSSGATFGFTVDAAIALSIGIILGPFWGSLLVMASTLTLDLVARRAFLKTTVNVLNLGLSTLAAALIYQWISDGAASPFATVASVVGLVSASLVYTAINMAVLAVIVSPIISTSPVQMWLSNIPPLTVELITLPSLGGIVPVLYNEHPLAPALFLVPLAGPFLAFRALHRVEAETRATIESLADALERRDPYTHHHSIRVTGYVEMILDQMPHIPIQTREVMLSAARVHDVGKVGVSDLILNKPGKLTGEEWHEVQRHPEIGSDIVNHLSIYRDEAAVVRHHHERWDGRGYPDGLTGTEIPLGSRVIGVADAFDAMTSDRAYRSGMTPQVALSVIRDGAGSQFDPEIVAALERAMSRSRAYQSAALAPLADTATA